MSCLEIVDDMLVRIGLTNEEIKKFYEEAHEEADRQREKNKKIIDSFARAFAKQMDHAAMSAIRGES